MMKLKLNSISFLKYLASYIIAFYLPASILFAVFYSFFVDAYKSEVINDNSKSVLRYKTAIDLQNAQFQKMASQILIEEEFYPINVQDDFKRIKTVERLHSYNISNAYVAEIVLFYRDSNILITSEGASDIIYLDKNIINYKYWSREDMVHELKYSNEKHWRRTEPVSLNGNSEKNILTYVYPLTRSGDSPFATVFFMVEENALFPAADVATQNNNAELEIIDTDGNLIYPPENSATLEPSELETISADSEEKVLKRYENEENMVSYIKSDINNWTYIWVSSSKHVLKKIWNLQLVSLILVGIIALIGGIVIRLFMQLNYNPLKKLMSHIKSSVTDVPEDISVFEAASYAIEKLQEANINMHAALSKSSSSIRNEALTKLIDGYFDSFDSFNRIVSNCGVTIESKLLCVTVLKLSKKNRMKDFDYSTLIKEIEEFSVDRIKIYCIDPSGKNEFALILCFDSFDEIRIKDLLFSIQQHLTQKLGLTSFAGVGSPCSNAAEVNQSYIEASLVVKSKIPEEGNGIGFYKAALKNMIGSYPSNEMEKLKNALCDRDVKAFTNISEALMQTIKDGRTSFFLAVCLCYDIINTIIKVMKKIEPDFLRRFKYESIAKNLSSNNVEELMDIIRKLLDEVKSCLIQNKEDQKSDTLEEKIKIYIQNNYNSINFSLQNLADSFGMSLSNISHYFKKQTAMTLMDYLFSLKIVQAKNLLLKTDCSIEEIARKLGYTNTTSLIRLFKQQVGMTPGDYRKANRVI